MRISDWSSDVCSSGLWPTISGWHGDSDATVSHENSALIVEQWLALHGVDHTPSAVEKCEGYLRRVWCDAHGHDVIEEYCIAGLGHGTPLSTFGADACGMAGPYMLEAGISSTRRIANFWGLRTVQSEGRADVAQPRPSAAPPSADTTVAAEPDAMRPRPQVAPSGLQRIIKKPLPPSGQAGSASGR